ncbi:hypothetical protein C8Q79DRAFT_682795 [Trametes meyenii]|nr:hypothetical protein C8Q79DRAFT_682795 [Trametes meyenii]
MFLDKTTRLEPTRPPSFSSVSLRFRSSAANNSTLNTTITEGLTNASSSASSTNTDSSSIHSTQSRAILTYSATRTERPVGPLPGGPPSTTGFEITSSRVMRPFATPTPIPQINFVFTQIPPVVHAEACIASIVRWMYNGPSGALITLTVVFRSSDTISQIVATDIDATAGLFMWQDVGLSPGPYTMEALGSAISASSDPFIVVGGKDPSCGELGNPSFGPLPVESPALATTSAPSTRVMSSAPAFSDIQSSSTTPKWPPSTTAAFPTEAGLIAGSIVGGTSLLIMIILVCICLRAFVWRRVHTSLPPSVRHGQYPAARWFGLSSSDIIMQTDSVDETSSPASVEASGPVLPRLEPNRHQPFTSFGEQISQSAPPRPQRDSLSMNAIARANSITRGRDSPTSPASPYRTRKPVPPLNLLPKTANGATPFTQDAWTPDGDSPGPNSAVPSSATSRMYRIRDSGASTQTRGGESGRARTSSVIDPGHFGAVKTMHRVIPGVPPIPPRKVD